MSGTSETAVPEELIVESPACYTALGGMIPPGSPGYSNPSPGLTSYLPAQIYGTLLPACTRLVWGDQASQRKDSCGLLAVCT